MKKVITILLLIAVMVFGAVACQKTPDSPIVVGKDNEKLIEKPLHPAILLFQRPADILLMSH